MEVHYTGYLYKMSGENATEMYRIDPLDDDNNLLIQYRVTSADDQGG